MGILFFCFCTFFFSFGEDGVVEFVFFGGGYRRREFRFPFKNITFFSNKKLTGKIIFFDDFLILIPVVLETPFNLFFKRNKPKFRPKTQPHL